MISRVASAPISPLPNREHFDKGALTKEATATSSKTTAVALTVIAAIIIGALVPALQSVIIGGLIIGAAIMALAYCGSCCGRGSTRDHHYHHVPHPVLVPGRPSGSGNPHYPVGGRHGPPAGPPVGPPPAGPGVLVPGGPRHYPVGGRPDRPAPPPDRRPPAGPPAPGGKYPVGARH